MAPWGGVGAGGARAKGCRVTLAAEERGALERLIPRGEADARRLAHARVPLLADEAEGLPPKRPAAFVHRMEDALAVCRRPHDPRCPVVCPDATFTQPIGETREPLSTVPGQVERYDCVYVRNATASLFLAFEPLAGWRQVAVATGRTRGDGARFVRRLLEGPYREVEKVVLVPRARARTQAREGPRWRRASRA